ncbi:protein disulfide oxidoreductase [Moraxella nasovis]|uniref:protein disulfide oxidoreductase n=1 Tax=Moraxella nasovis TaxID=2904121 RepID=UPI001F614790|nr:protein disulfide oxidoreductase [Moraxella nasovis]UNU73878.1 protein disulfide oxidoreductase [Moraxella nasovis]
MSNITKALLSLLKYAAFFIIIYIAVNMWRSPTLPAAPSLAYIDTHGQAQDAIAQSHKTPVLVYFWGTWCSVCRLTTPNVAKLHENGIQVVSVAVQSGDNDELSAYLNQHGYHFLTINDSDGRVFNQWQGQVTPSFVILKDGNIAQSFTGIAPLWLLKARLWWANLN